LIFYEETASYLRQMVPKFTMFWRALKRGEAAGMCEIIGIYTSAKM
jgi:hypothetical protein